MKKTLFVTLMTFVTLTIVNQRDLLVNTAEAFVSPAAALRAAAVAHLPAGQIVPEILHELEFFGGTKVKHGRRFAGHRGIP